MWCKDGCVLQHRAWADGGAVQLKSRLSQTTGRCSRTSTHRCPSSGLCAGGAFCPADAEEPGALEEEANREGESPSPQIRQGRG